ncbi:MAG: hypothetical protein K5871_07850 [Lachnospiraceae bacterium]|nr:hypothetical protein [Lachnospiraceae bacterium]
MSLSQSKRSYLIFLVIIVILFATDLISASDILYRAIHLNSLFTVVFCPVLIFWGFSVNSRIIMPQVKRCLVAISVFLLMLFVIRTCRWEFFYGIPRVNIFLWYMYYIPFVTVPTLSFHASIRTGTDPESKAPSYVSVIWAIALLIIASFLTNDLHGQLLIIDDDYSYTHGWLYYVFIAYSVIMTIASLVILFRKCHLSLCRKQIHIPLTLSLTGCVLTIIYLAIGGSPELFGIKLYHIQEIYSLIFIGLWEGCIIIGLLPSNAHYRKLFSISHTGAELISSDQSTHYESAGQTASGSSEDLIQKEFGISGGLVRWTEDMRTIRNLNEELTEAGERISEENDLIEEENRIMEEYGRYETLNRLYDSIADHTRDTVTRLDAALSDTDSFEKNIIPNLLLGTYVKRCANLILLSGTSKEMSSEEISLSIRESFETLSIAGIDCMLTNSACGKVSSDAVIAAYDLFESVAEKVINDCSVISVGILPASGVILKIETDAAYSGNDLPDRVKKFRSSVTIDEGEEETSIVFRGDVHD